MKTLTDNLLHPQPTRFTLHASPFFPAALAQEFPVDTCNPFIPSEPNFQTSRLSVTLAMIRTYNETCPKKHKKSKPNPNPIQPQSKPDPNPTKPNFYPQFYIFLTTSAQSFLFHSAPPNTGPARKQISF